MSALTPIEWTDRVWNPLRGCARVSESCRNCYAERVAWRFGSKPGTPYHGLVQMTSQGPKWTGKVQVLPLALNQPAYWKTPSRVFVNSMSDLFHEGVPDDFIEKVFAVMARHPQHTFQLLTKRPERMVDWLRSWTRHRGHRPLSNLWPGTSVEDQETADARVPTLLLAPSAYMLWLSMEPLLGPVDIARWLAPECQGAVEAGNGYDRGVRWVVVGGESGPGARPMHPDWARSLRNQCAAAGVPFFFKQWGEWGDPDSIERTGLAHHGWWETDRQDGGVPRHDWPGQFQSTPHEVYRVGKKAAGRLLDGAEHNSFPDEARP